MKDTGKILGEAEEELILHHWGRKIGIFGVGEYDWLDTLTTFEPHEVDYIDFV